MLNSVLDRVGRIVRANIMEAVEDCEKSQAEKIMKEAIREAELAIDEVKFEMDHYTEKRLIAEKHMRMIKSKIKDLNEKATFALKQEREDLAKAATGKIVDFESQTAALKRDVEAHAEVEAKLSACIGALDMRKGEMKEKLKAVLDANFEVQMKDGGLNRSPRKADSKMSNAEAAFNRAMGLSDADTVDLTQARQDRADVAEIAVMQRTSKIDERMDELRTTAQEMKDAVTSQNAEQVEQVKQEATKEGFWSRFA